MNRFSSVTSENHNKMLDSLSREFEINVYNFLRNEPINGCPYTVGGNIQVYDFVKHCLTATQEDIVIKVRSDIWFTDSSIDVLKQQLNDVINGIIDVSFLGLDLRNCVQYKFSLMPTLKLVTDFMIIVYKSKIKTPNEIYDTLKNHAHRSGNKAYKWILKESTNYRAISCQMYLVRKNYSIPDKLTILQDWSSEYKNITNSIDWISKNKNLIQDY